MWLTRWKTEILIFVMTFLAGAAFYHPVEYDNTVSRYILLSAIVDYGTLNIDAYQTKTMDKSEWGGHYYSVKAPGASFLGVPVYWFLRNYTPLKSFSPFIRLNMYIVRVITTTLLFAFLGVVMYRLALLCGAFPRQALLMVIAYGFGSIALLHATLFSGHQIAACLGFFSFALMVWLFVNQNQRTGFKNLGFGFLAGICSGFAVLTDYPAVVIAFFMAVYVMTAPFKRQIKTGFIAGGFVCLIILAVYNTFCFGHPFSFSYGNMVEKEFQALAAQGILGVGFPRLESLWGLLFSPSRGVFFIMPVFLLSIWGIVRMIDRKNLQRETFLITGIVIGSFLLISGCSGWKAGMTFGPRYLVFMLPFLAFPIAFLRRRPYCETQISKTKCIEICKSNNPAISGGYNTPPPGAELGSSSDNYRNCLGVHTRDLFWLLFIPSCFQVILPVIGVPHVNEGIANPIKEFIIPGILKGETAWNLVELLGLVWPWSAMTIIFLIALICFGAFRSIGRDESTSTYERVSFFTVAFLVCWVCAITVMLVVMRT